MHECTNVCVCVCVCACLDSLVGWVSLRDSVDTVRKRTNSCLFQE